MRWLFVSLLLSCGVAHAQPSVVNSVATNGTNADPSVCTLGFSPSSGNTLIAIVRLATVQTVDAVTDEDANSWSIDVTGDTSRWAIARLSNIPAGISTVHFNVSAAAISRCHVIEVSGLANSSQPETTFAYAASGEGSATSHGHAYTTAAANELVVYGVQFSAGRTMTGTNGTTVLQASAPDNEGAAYEVISAAESGDLTFTLDTAATSTGLGVAYSPAAGGTTPLRRRRS
jgi:hypothetical protein